MAARHCQQCFKNAPLKMTSLFLNIFYFLRQQKKEKNYSDGSGAIPLTANPIGIFICV
jgi:hypothetical protein